MASQRGEDGTTPTTAEPDQSYPSFDFDLKKFKQLKGSAMPFTGTDGDPLYDCLKSAVSTTNAALAAVEERTTVVSATVLSRVRSVGGIMQHSFRDAQILYNRRGQYGPQIVAGTACAFGCLVSLRRGRIPGAVVGAMAGAGAYANIYGIEIFGVAKDTRKIAS